MQNMRSDVNIYYSLSEPGFKLARAWEATFPLFNFDYNLSQPAKPSQPPALRIPFPTVYISEPASWRMNSHSWRSSRSSKRRPHSLTFLLQEAITSWRYFRSSMCSAPCTNGSTSFGTSSSPLMSNQKVLTSHRLPDPDIKLYTLQASPFTVFKNLPIEIRLKI